MHFMTHYRKQGFQRFQLNIPSTERRIFSPVDGIEIHGKLDCLNIMNFHCFYIKLPIMENGSIHCSQMLPFSILC